MAPIAPVSTSPQMSEPSILIVVGQVLTDPWYAIARDGQMKTWLGQELPARISVRHSFARRPGSLMRAFDSSHEWLRWHGRGRTLIPRIDAAVGRRWLGRLQAIETTTFVGDEHDGWSQSMPDIYALQRWKVIGSLTMAIQEEFDFVYFTTASSYVRPSKLCAIVESLPSQGVYAGTTLVDAISGHRFASGANRLLSRDVAELVVENKRAYRNDVMEDVGLGRLLYDLGVSFTDLPTQNIASLDELFRTSDAQILSGCHFRLTSGSRRDRHDVVLMHALHDRLRILSQAAGVEDAER